VTIQQEMPDLHLWMICVILLIGSGLATEIPYAFDEKSSSLAGYTSEQLERVSSSSADLLGIPPMSALSNDAVIEISEIGGGDGRGPVTKTKWTVGELKEVFDARVEPDNAYVNHKALMLAARYPGDRSIDQICSIFQYIKQGDVSTKGWSYVGDPRGIDVYHFANETLKVGESAGCSGAGDCDDFAIVMSSLIESIGGTTRVVLAFNKSKNSEGHAYAQVFLGNSEDRVEEIVNWLKQRYETDKIFAYVDPETKDVWLNLDWSADHPGGQLYGADNCVDLRIREEFYRTAIEVTISPKKIEAEKLNSKGTALAQQSKYDEAIEAFDKATELNPQYATAWNGKGNALYIQNKFDEAIQAYDKAIEINPQYADAWIGKGNVLYGMGKNDEAIQAYDKAIEINPQYATAWNGKGNALYIQYKFDETIQAYDKAIEINPQYADAWIGKGNALSNQGKNEEAIKAFDEAIRLDPNLEYVWRNKGLTLDDQGRYDDAIKAYDEAIKLDPNDDAAWNRKGDALRNQGKYDEAIKAYDKAIELNPQYAADAWNSKGRALREQGKNDEAIQAFNKAIELDPQFIEAWNNKGIALDHQGKNDEAIQAFNKAIEIKPQYAEAWNSKGAALFALGRYDEAIQAFNKAGNTFKKLGQITEANAAFTKARELGYSG
jgi:tetratricopeptide (TPR) repeat protein